MPNKDFNIDYIINNTRILTEFTIITDQIKELVKNLPNSSDLKDKLHEIENNLNQMTVSLMAAEKRAEQDSERIERISTIEKNIELHDKKADSALKKAGEILTLLKYKYPFIIAAITTLIYLIGFFIQLHYGVNPIPSIPIKP